jgi:hypothetical protein
MCERNLLACFFVITRITYPHDSARYHSMSLRKLSLAAAGQHNYR